MKNKIKIVLNFLFITIFIIGISITIPVLFLVSNLEVEPLIYKDEVTPSYIYDNKNEIVKTINRKYKLNVSYDELPTQFVMALTCAEDLRFFNHEGIDTSRLFSALYNNIIESSYAQGASTLTQQLIKNTHLDNDKNIVRKVKEMILAYKLEKKLSKQEIFEAYSNIILFDGITPGVNNASNKFFAKNIWEVNLVEACALAALVKSPTKYNPLRYPSNNFERRNQILKTMYEYNYISGVVYNEAIKIPTEDLLKEKSDVNTYPYQAYIDIVYKEVEELTGLSPYTTPMKIYTYLDKELQSQLDLIQQNKDDDIIFNDDNQQIASCVIDNQQGALVGVIGGRNYVGERLLNRASDVRRQPASTIKPILSYALAMEYLNWSDIHVVEDIPYMYPGTNTSVKNVDNRYMGELLLEEALGYSRNTVALKTLQEVIDKVGINTVLDYLEAIDMLDCSKDEFNMSYGIGGMYYGVTPLQLANAFSIFPNEGNYKKATTIKYIELLDEVIVSNNRQTKVLSKETAFKMSNVLKKVVDNNYWSMGSLKLKNRDIAAKTGTSNFDYATLTRLNYPVGACKDIWYVGFSKDYTVSVWTGFDQNLKNQKTYFDASKDKRVLVAKKVLNKILSLKAKEGVKFTPPDSLYLVGVVRGVYPYSLPDEYTPSHLITYGYFKKEEIPNEFIKPEDLPEIIDILLIRIDDKIKIIFETDEKNIQEATYGKKLYSNEMIYGKVCYNVKISDDNIIKSTDKEIEISIDELESSIIDCYLSYEKKEVETSHKYLDIII